MEILSYPNVSGPIHILVGFRFQNLLVDIVIICLTHYLTHSAHEVTCWEAHSNVPLRSVKLTDFAIQSTLSSTTFLDPSETAIGRKFVLSLFEFIEFV